MTVYDIITAILDVCTLQGISSATRNQFRKAYMRVLLLDNLSNTLEHWNPEIDLDVLKIGNRELPQAVISAGDAIKRRVNTMSKKERERVFAVYASLCNYTVKGENRGNMFAQARRENEAWEKEQTVKANLSGTSNEKAGKEAKAVKVRKIKTLAEVEAECAALIEKARARELKRELKKAI